MRVLQIVTSVVGVVVVAMAINVFVLPPLPTPEEISEYMNSPQYLIDKAAAFRAAEERAKYNF